MMRGFLLLPVIGLSLMLVASDTAVSQVRHNSAAPIDFDAANIELQDRANRAILSGGVVIRQATMTLNAARVTVAYTGEVIGGSPQVSRLDATGGVTVVRPNQTARSQYAVYNLDRRVITMLGNVTLTQGANTISGGRLSINLDTGRATIDGSNVGSGTSEGEPTRQGGRVTGRFSVPDRQ